MPAMGIVLRTKLQGIQEQDIGGKGLIYAYDELVHAAKATGVPALAEFTDAAADYESYPEIHPPDYVPPPKGWHSASEGLLTVRAIIGYVESHFEGIPHRDLVVADLRGLQLLLEFAERQGVEFNLYWDL